MKIINCVQGTPEWYAVRCGIPTASSFDKILCADGKISKQRTKYLNQLAGELVAGKSEETYQNATMLRGKEMEAEARQLYELITGQEVVQVGFCLAEGFGCSPDGLVAKEGLLEVKCPIVATQVGYLLDNKIPVEYFQQIQGQLLVTGREWVDFLSYYPGLKPLFIRVNRDEKFIALLQAELKVFCEELKEVVKKIK